ncbi:hypothetical protein SB749_12570 [Brevibacterium sp. SIMBA_078]|uniref:hypothetical protein n=1 Tax=Brevibacterium sp. SIMBA_078 TaxID=3085816 RepID=UPI00397C118B
MTSNPEQLRWVPKGTRIREYVEKFAPSRASLITDPEHYVRLHEELSERQDQIFLSLEPDRPPTVEETQDPLTLLGRSRRNHRQAQEMAWQEIVLDRYPAEVDEDGQPLET